METFKNFFLKLAGFISGHKKKVIGALVAGAVLLVSLLHTGGPLKPLWDKLRPSNAVTGTVDNDVPVVPDDKDDSVEPAGNSPPPVVEELGVVIAASEAESCLDGTTQEEDDPDTGCSPPL